MNLNNLIQYAQVMNLPDPLSGINVPSPINAGMVRSAIVVRCGMLTPVYTNPEVFRQTVSDWFSEKQWTFEHLINIIQAEYSPIENVDEYTEYSDSRTRKDAGGITETRKSSGSDTDSNSFTDIKTNNGGFTNTASGSDTVTNTVSAENSNTYQPDNESVTAYGKTDTNEHEDNDRLEHSGSGTKKRQDEMTISRSNTGSGTDDNKHIGHRHGNIGVTSNQQLITAELDLLRHFDIYRYIAETFEADNMLMIY